MSTLHVKAESFLKLADELLPLIREAEPEIEASASPKLLQTQDALLDASLRLTHQLRGPLGHLESITNTQWTVLALRFLLDYDIFRRIPLGGSATLQSLAQAAGCDQGLLGRMLRTAATQYITREKSLGVFEHTPTSEALVRDDGALAFTDMATDSDDGPTQTETMRWITRKGDQTAVESAFELKHGVSVYEWLGKRPEKLARFQLSMKGYASRSPGNRAQELLDWLETSQVQSGTLVDVAGGNGHIGIEAAKAYPNLKVIIQDQHPEPFDAAIASVSPSVASRVSYETHDFLTPERTDRPEINIYYIRWSIHNYSDDKAIQIIKGFVPAMRAHPKTTLLLHDTIVPALGEVFPHQEHDVRKIDIPMLVLFNGKERTELEWRELLRSADEGLEVVKVIKGANKMLMGIMEIRLRT